VIIFAAIDLQEGEVVQLVGGRKESLRVRLPDPLAVADRWVDAGFRALHVVDLDAARGTGSNLPAIEALIRQVPVPVQVGGGIRSEADIERVLEAGAERVIVGTRAIEDESWRASATQAHPGRIVVAADVRNDLVLTRGWTHETPRRLDDVIADLNRDPLAAVLVTDVGREGRMTGVDELLFANVCARSQHPVFAAGGIGDNNDIALLERLGAAGTVLGMALYTGNIDLTRLGGVNT
jgi:phosphoribosylformimino-5-aminoimidazole carboxamide ribotide isomerase